MSESSQDLAGRAIITVRKLLERGWYDEALPMLSDALELHPTHVELILLYAETFALKGNMLEALHVLIDANRRMPKHADLALRLGQFLAIDGQHVAMDLFGRIEAEHEMPALVILERAMTLSDLGRFADAHAEVERALVLEPGYWDAWMELGRLKIEVGDWSGAVKPLRRAMELAEPTAELIVDLAAAYLHQGFIEEAEKVLDQGEKLEPGHPGIAYYRAAVAAGRGEIDDALRHLQHALENGHEGIRRLL
ncbi:MAG: tetratricopeptide repeat protein, partial [Myxococcota bacterium]|nr:tetratricopeptide repeat protein [Myxococcota bacterium]